MRPGFSPVFPGMGGGIGADIAVLPVGGRALFIMAFECHAIILTFITKIVAEFIDQFRMAVLHHIKIIMAAFMAKMAKQGAVVFSHGYARGFPVHHIGFNGIEGNKTIGVAGQHRLAFHGH